MPESPLPKKINTPGFSSDEATLEAKMPGLLERWSRGEISLKDIYGFTEEELYGIASQGYLLLMQGKIQPAKTIFEGLVAIDPKNDYYYRALGMIYHRLGETEKAIRQFGYAIKVQEQDLMSYVNRAEIYMQQKRYSLAEQDLQQVLILSSHDPEHPMYKKAQALLAMLQ